MNFLNTISDENGGVYMMFNPEEFSEEVCKFYDPETGEDDGLFVEAIEGISIDVWNPRNNVLFHRVAFGGH